MRRSIQYVCSMKFGLGRGKLVEIADAPEVAFAIEQPTLEQFLSSLRTAWQEGKFGQRLDGRRGRRKSAIPQIRSRWRPTNYAPVLKLSRGGHRADCLPGCRWSTPELTRWVKFGRCSVV